MNHITITLHLTHDEEADELTTQTQMTSIVHFLGSSYGLTDKEWYPHLTLDKIEAKIEE